VPLKSTIAVEVGAVMEKPDIFVAVSLSATPAELKVNGVVVAYFCELVGITFAPEAMLVPERLAVVEEFPTLIMLTVWFVETVSDPAGTVP
jgi:hypothetical protein